MNASTTTATAARARRHRCRRSRTNTRRASRMPSIAPFLLLLVAHGMIAWNNNVLSSSSSSFSSSSAEAAAAEAVDVGTAATPANRAGGDGSGKPRGVIALDSMNFDSSLRNGGKVWLIEFYAPWCGHCTRFASTYELVAKQLHSDDHPNNGIVAPTRKVNVAKIDGAAERALSSRFDVHGFPSFFLVDGWTVREYKGNRSHEGLVKFALTDYAHTEPVPFITGPFGPMGQLRSLLMRSGAYIVGMYEDLTKAKGMGPLMAMSVLCVGGLAVGLVSIIILGVVFLPKAKLE